MRIFKKNKLTESYINIGLTRRNVKFMKFYSLIECKRRLTRVKIG